MSETNPDRPFLSIIVNCYNYENFVGEAIDSAIAASDEGCEIIVVDDGSTDGSLDIIRGYDGIKVVAKENGGQASALNAGFDVSHGHYVHFLDADDLLVPEAVEVIRRTMQGRHLMWYAIEVLDNDVGLASFYPSSRVKPDTNLWGDYFGKGAAWLRPMSGNIFSRELLNNIFPLPEEYWRICADHIALCFAASFTGYDGCNEVINRYRFHGNNYYFSNTLSTLDTHIYEDRYIVKNSTHYRHFYVAGCDALVRVDDVDRYAAVFSHWLALGEILKEDAMLLDRHRADIEAASDRLLNSQTPAFWQDAAQVLYQNKIAPDHLRAFHQPPFEGVLQVAVEPEKMNAAPILEFEKPLGPKMLKSYLQGGFEVWSEGDQRMAFSLGQACRFRARLNRLSGVFRAVFEMNPDTVLGALRLVNRDGGIAEVVEDDGEWRADIPFDWIQDGELEFFFVFESLQIPQAMEWSSFDACLTGGYLTSCRFEVPPANHFYPPLRYGQKVPASRCLSPVRQLRSVLPLSEPEVVEDGSVELNREPTYFGISLPFSQKPCEWLEFEVENSSDAPCAMSVATEFTLDQQTRTVTDRIVLAAQESRTVVVPIGFELFSGALPEVKFALLAAPDKSGSVRILSVQHRDGYEQVLDVPRMGELAFDRNALPVAGFSTGWIRAELGLRPDVERPGSITFQVDKNGLEQLALMFGNERNSRQSLPLKQVVLNVNGSVLSCDLSEKGVCLVPPDGDGRATITGWWAESSANTPLLLRAWRHRSD